VNEKALTLCFGLALVTACASARPSGAHEVRVGNYVFGAFGGRGIDVRDLCGSQPARTIEVHREAIDYVVSVVTIGMYLPHRVRVRCAETTQ
jgi:hypothetical protein